MRSYLLLCSFLLSGVPGYAAGGDVYNQQVLSARKEQAEAIDAPTGWLSLVALQPLTTGDVSVGSAPGNTLRLEHGLPHAFTLHVDAGKVTFASVSTAITVDGKHPQPSEALSTEENDKATLHWGDLYAYVIQRTGNQTYLRVGDPNSANRRHFQGLNYFSIDSRYRISARWVPYTTPHEIRMATVLGTTLTEVSAGYAEFTLNGKIIRLDGTEASQEEVAFSFRDGTFKTSTYGAGRHVTAERPSNGLKAPGTMVIDFNMATNWPCAYTQYGTCPLPPVQNRFAEPIPAGEKRYHD